MGALWDRFLKTLSPIQVCWLCLLLTFGGGLYGLNTFARDSELKQVRVELLQQRLVDLRIRQCEAVRKAQPADFFAKQITEQAGKYRELTYSPPDLPKCNEL